YTTRFRSRRVRWWYRTTGSRSSRPPGPRGQSARPLPPAPWPAGWWRRESRARGLRPAPPASAGTTAGWLKGSRQQRARSASAVRHFASWAILPALAAPLGRGGDGPLQLIGDVGREARRERRKLMARLDVSLFHKVERPLQAHNSPPDAGAVLPLLADAESRAEHHRCNRD